LSLLVAFLLFLSGQYALLIAESALVYGIPYSSDYRDSSKFSRLVSDVFSQVYQYASYETENISRDSEGFQSLLKEQASVIEKQRAKAHALFAPIEWLRENPPVQFYVEELGVYLIKQDYERFLRNKEDALNDEVFPYTTEYADSEDEVYSPSSAAAEVNAPETAAVEKIPGAPAAGEAESYASRFPKAKYNNIWDSYMKDALSQFLSGTDEYFSTKQDSLSLAVIDAYFDQKITDMQASNTLWIDYQNNAQAAKDYLGKAANLRFAALNRATSKVYSNFALSDASAESLLATISAAGNWYMYYTVERGFVWSRSQQRWPVSTPFSSDESGGQPYAFYFFLPATLTENDSFLSLQNKFESLQTSFNGNVTGALVLLALAAAIAVYLIVAAGRKSDGSLALMAVDKSYHDVHFLLSFAAAGGLLFLCAAGIANLEDLSAYLDTGGDTFFYRLMQTGLSLAFAAAGMLMLEWFISASRNIKKEHFLRQTLCYKLLCIPRWFFRKLRKLYRFLKQSVFSVFSGDMVNLKKSVLLAAAGYVGGNGILVLFTLATSYRGSGSLLFWLFVIALFNAMVLLLLLKSIRGLDRIMGAARSIRSGELNTALNMSEIPSWLRPFTKDILDNQEGLRNAVADAIKNERMKAELITNVSHDLKTPLTSIVSYVSLLKKCDIEDEDAQKYVAVLDEKAERMKRLIEDLVEASKASTGNIPLNLVHVNLYELAVQAIGENSDDLEAKGIDCRIHDPEGLVVVLGDSQRTWRVIDNLFSNAKKYAMQGTRIYIEVKAENGYGVFTMKNISKNALNIPAEELTQRFVRGDEARGGEGSGLGLSIAKSLCELQKGAFDIEIDGDLFKAIVRLPLV
jgi:signal transduction histidine kinase